jgi:cytochrome oxidase Cu insertion factor (SCO1/SenC/PrrC family)
MRVAVLIALLLAVAGCGGESDTAAPETTQPQATQPETTQPETTQPETTHPETAEPGASAVAGTTLDGEPISLDDFRGKPVFVNVWSSW